MHFGKTIFALGAMAAAAFAQDTSAVGLAPVGTVVNTATVLAPVATAVNTATVLATVVQNTMGTSLRPSCGGTHLG